MNRMGNAIANVDTIEAMVNAKVRQMIDLSFFKIVFAENQYFLVECCFDLDSVVIRIDHQSFFFIERL